MVASEAFLAFLRPLVVADHTHHHLPFLALVVRAKQVATVERTCSEFKTKETKHHIKFICQQKEDSPWYLIVAVEVTCWDITSLSSCSLAFTSFCASSLSLISSSTLPEYSRINCKNKTIGDQKLHPLAHILPIREYREYLRSPGGDTGRQSRACYWSKQVLEQRLVGLNHNIQRDM